MSLNKQFTILVPLTLVLVTLLAYNFMSAQWSAPTGAPPTGNTDAPINTGGTPQVKTGGLSTGALSINGSLGVSSVNPLIYMSDTDGRPFWLYSNNSYFYLLTSRDADPNTIESPYPMTMFADNNPANDYVYFNNQVRAAEYCDNGGGNCSTAAEIKSSAGGNVNSGNPDCDSLPICGSAGDTNLSVDCRVSSVVNNYTGQALCVSRTNVSGLFNWGEAMDACRIGKGSRYHLPNVAQLNQIYAQRVAIGGLGSQGGIFPFYFWSSTMSNSMDGEASAVHLSTGALSSSFTTRAMQVRCVRGDL